MMNFMYEPALLEYMDQKKKSVVVVEVVTSDSSDFEVAELHVHLADQKRADFLCEKKKYRSVETGHGKVLLPPRRMEYEEIITFGLKSFLCIHWLTCDGIRL